MSIDPNYRRMISSKQWREIRRVKMKESPLCEDCLENGRYEPAQEIHHIRPAETAVSVEEMERLMFDYNNLRSLCHDCHIATHARMKTHSRKEARKNVERRNDRFIQEFLT